MKSEVKDILVKLYEITKAPLTFFDIESTGLDKIQDEIIQLYLCKYDGKTFSESNSYYNTNIDTQSRQEAFDKHGITNDFLVNYPFFQEVAKDIYSEYFNKGTVLCGYRSNRFDIPFIIEKLLQCGIPTAVNILQNKRIDAYEVYVKAYPNTLDQVFDRLVGGDMGEAHEAKNDVVATIKIMDTLVLKGIDDVVTHSEFIDTDEFFKRVDNDIFFAKGKLKGENILKMNPQYAIGFLKWMQRTHSISIHSRTIAMKLVEKLEKSIIAG